MAAIYTDEFYQFLAHVQTADKFTPIIRQIPYHEATIKVDLDSREIKIENSDYNEFLSLEKDHRSELVYFEVDRYFEDIDLLYCTTVIEYLNARPLEKGGPQLRLYPITIKDIWKVEDEEGNIREKLILAWNIGSEATYYAGTIQFALWFFKINTDAHVITDSNGEVRVNDLIYSLHTLPAKGHILYGMEYSDEIKTEYDYYATIQEQNFAALMAQINQKNVYWNNL